MDLRKLEGIVQNTDEFSDHEIDGLFPELEAKTYEEIENAVRLIQKHRPRAATAIRQCAVLC